MAIYAVLSISILYRFLGEWFKESPLCLTHYRLLMCVSSRLFAQFVLSVRVHCELKETGGNRYHRTVLR